MDQRREPGRALPHRGRTMAGHDPGEITIAGSEIRDSVVQGAAVERLDQTTEPPLVNPAAGSGSNGRPSAPRSQARAFSPSEGR